MVIARLMGGGASDGLLCVRKNKEADPPLSGGEKELVTGKESTKLLDFMTIFAVAVTARSYFVDLNSKL